MTPTPYLFFNGQCAEAIADYAEIFGGEILEQLPASQLPPEYPVPDDRKDWVMHSRMKIGDGFLMASDSVMTKARLWRALRSWCSADGCRRQGRLRQAG